MSSISRLAFAFAVLAIVNGQFSPRPHHFREEYEREFKARMEGRSRFQGNAEPYLSNIRPLTTAGVNAEAYWNFDGSSLSFQAIRDTLAETHPCDQIYTMTANGTNIRLISNGEGRDTCSYYTKDGQYVLYASTRSVDGPYCAPTPDMNYGYVWAIYNSMELYRVRLQDGNLEQLTHNDAYDAELTMSADGKQAVFTSTRDGDLELYIMNSDATGLVRRMTYTPGYDGGAWFSHDGKKLVWRASRPQGDNLTDYRNLLSMGLVKPSDMQIYIMDIDQPDSQQKLTNLPGVANFAPVFSPDDQWIIFSSNMLNPAGGEFQLFVIDTQGGNMHQLTTNGMFNAFPMFSPDGKWLAWESSRNAVNPQDINVFVAQWQPPTKVQKTQN